MTPAIAGDWNSVVRLISSYVFNWLRIFSMILREDKGCPKNLERQFCFK